MLPWFPVFELFQAGDLLSSNPSRPESPSGSLYPPGPEVVPSELTKATAAYKRHAWLALFGLWVFVALYLFLSAAFVWTAYRALSGASAGGKDSLLGLLVAGIAAVLSIFLLKALLFVKTSREETEDIEITAEQEPRLFEFLHQLADEAGAPRPHRVFVSTRVNAAVFYDLTFLNLLFPSKKNLEIGLGLVNTLTLSEFKAVLAHEFGHFAQRSMAVGRWVYTAQQIAGHIVAKRDWLDSLLGFVSRIDLRVAWIGWILRILVWSIRAVMDTVFGIVVLAQRALSREMEFQADLVAVRLTGSDALIHALHRLGAADDAWDRALSVAGSELAEGRAVPDLFAVQTRVIERMRVVLGEEDHGRTPELPASGRPEHRVFESEMAEPPRMWATHPPNRDREDNAKRTYIPAILDDRSAWDLFSAPETLRTKVTAGVLRQAEEGKQPEVISVEDSLESVDRKFARVHFEQKYRGVYLGRSAVAAIKHAKDLYGVLPAGDALPAALRALYPASLAQQLADYRSRTEEKVSLEALRDGILQAPGGIIRHRGRSVKRSELPQVLEVVTDEHERAHKVLLEHDQACRAAHRAAARALGRGWEDYLVSLGGLLHYATHAEADLVDAKGHLANVVSVVTADGRISSSERQRLLIACAEMHTALEEVYSARSAVVLPAPIAEKLEVATWAEMLEDNFSLPPADAENLGDWMGVIDGWANGAIGAVGALERAALDLLLETEEHVGRCFSEGDEPGDAPPPAGLPARYKTLTPGQERERQKRLDWWDRFQTADGLMPSLARFVVAGGIVGGVLGFGATVGHATVTIYNGLGRRVEVSIAGAKTWVDPGRSAHLDLASTGAVPVEAKTATGETIESFRAPADNAMGDYVYNVASAAPLVEWTASYGTAREVPERQLGTVRWQSTRVDFLFREPPESVSTSGGGATRDVLDGLGGRPPQHMLSVIADESTRKDLTLTHVEWDEADSPFIIEWMTLGAEHAGFAEALGRRLKRNPREVVSLRAEQDSTRGVEHQEVCAKHRKLLDEQPDNVDLKYVTARCIEDDEEQNRAYLSGAKEHPEHGWFVSASGFSRLDARAWNDALVELRRARALLPPVADRATLEMARVRRLLEGATPSDLRSMAGGSFSLERALAFETGEGVEGSPLQAYSALARGDLDAAVRTARSDRDVLARVLRLAAVSEGASDEVVEEALALPVDAGVDFATVWPSIALRVRRAQPYEQYVEAARRIDEQYVDRILPFLDAESLRADYEGLVKRLGEVPFMVRAQADVVALVMLGKEAPPALRQETKALLFAFERPHFE